MADKSNYHKYKKLKSSTEIIYRGYLLKFILATDYIKYSYDKVAKIGVRNIVGSLFFRNDLQELINKIQSSKVLFTTSSYGSDHQLLLEAIMHTVLDSTIYSESEKNVFSFSFNIAIRSVNEILSLRRDNKLSFNEQIYYYLRLVYYKKLIDQLEDGVGTIMVQKYVPFMSCFAPDSIYCQFFKKRGIKSYGIQHGLYSSEEYYKSVVPIDVINIENFQADYFLGWGTFMEETLKSEGFEDGTFLLAGNPKYANINNLNLSKLSFTKCVVCLARDYYSSENKQLLRVASELQSNNIDVIIKLHPRSDVTLYESYIEEFSLRILQNSVTVSDSIDSYNIDFAIVYNSTVYYEYYLNNIIAFRYSYKENDIPFGLDDRFNSIKELKELINRYSEYNCELLSRNATEMVNRFCAIGINNYSSILKV